MGRRRVDLQTAAELLGISSDAVRKRAKRGTIPYETGVDGKLYVWVDNRETSDYPAGEREHDHGYQGAPDQGDRDELVEELRDRVRALEEANRENRRIIAALTQRIPEIEPPQDSAPESRGAPETASEGESGTEVSAGDTDEPRRSSSWWRRFFGFE